MRKWLIGCGALVVSALLCGGVGWIVASARVHARTSPNARFYTVERGEIVVEVSESGAVEPVRVVEIKSRVPGRIEALLVDEGAVVERGQLLARIDPREIQQQVEQGGAQVESARAQAQRAQIALELEAEQARLQLRQAQIRYEQAKREAEAQPHLTQAALKNAAAELRTAQENLRLLQEVRHPQERVELANAIRDAETRLQEAQRNYQRLQNLLEKGYVSRQQVDAAHTQLVAAESQLRNLQQRQQQLAEQHAIELANARARVEAAQAELERARTNAIQDELKRQALEAAHTELENARARLRAIEMRRLELQQARASEKQALSQFENLRIQLAETDVRAPIRGVVTRRYREVGELVMSGTTGFGEGTPILQVADLSQMRVKLNLNELDVAKVRVGMPVEITVDALPNRRFTGTVRKIAPAAQSNPQGGALGVVKFAVEVYLDQADPALRPGMTARCRIIVARNPNALRLPLEAIGKENGKEYVLRLVPNQTTPEGMPQTEKLFVKIGLRSARYAEILEGVKEGDRVQKPPFGGPARRQLELNGDDSEGTSEGS